MELHEIARTWLGQVAAAASIYGFQCSHLPEDWAEKLREIERLMRENEHAIDKEFPEISEYRKKHFQKIGEIATGAMEHPDASDYMIERAEELLDFQDRFEKSGPEAHTSQGL